MSADDQVEALKRAIAAVTRPQFGVHVSDPTVRARARALLNCLMTAAQREDCRHTGRFIERVGGVRYRVGRVIEVLGDAGEVVETWCTYPLGLCIEDVLIAQLLHLRSSPETLRRQANVVPRVPLGSPNPDARLQFLLRRTIGPPISVGDRGLWNLLGSRSHGQLRALYDESMRRRDPKPESRDR